MNSVFPKPAEPEIQAAKIFFTRRHHALLAAGFLAFVIYGSFVPFQFRAMSWDDALATYRKALIFRGFDSRSDLLANILLFIPLSYLLLAATSVDRSKWVSWVIAPPVLLFCFLLSGTIEFIQVFFEKRYADINDIIGESIGAAIGIAVWLGFGRTITAWGRRVWSNHLGSDLPGLLLPGYLLFLVLYHVLPLDLTLSPAEIVHKYRDGKIQIIPYAVPPGDHYEWVEKQCWTLALFFPVGMLWAGQVLPKPDPQGTGLGSMRRSWLMVLGLAFLLAALITFLKIFVVSRYVETGDIITGTVAAFLGWLACREGARGEAQSRDREGAVSVPLPHGRGSEVPWLAVSWPWLFFAAVWLAMVVFVNWHPFDFQPDIETGLDRLRHLSWLPFADYIQGSYVNFLNQIVRKGLLFLPIGLLLGFRSTSRNEGMNRTWFLLLAFALALILEIGQAFLPSRYPSITDVLVETSGAAIGLVLAPRILTGSVSEVSSHLADASG